MTIFKDRRISRIATPFALMLAPTLTLFAAAPAAAQFSDSYKFLQAVRKQDGEIVVKYVEAPGTTLVNTRDASTGETALLITVGREDAVWTRYLLGHGARTDLADRNGRFPLMVAVEKRFVEGIEILLGARADVNQANRSGETALIRAVQLRNLPIIRLLMNAGADPDKPDALAGMSARDYANRDGRDAAILAALDIKKTPAKGARPVQGPSL